MDYSIIKIGEKIRELRTNAGLSQDGLIKKLNEEYQFEIARKTLSRIENGEQISEKSISLPLLSALADLFDCQIGYILGEIECKKRSEQTIKDVTGLSPESCENLVSVCGDNDLLEAVDFLLKHDEFKDMIANLSDYGYSHNDIVRIDRDNDRFYKSFNSSNTRDFLKYSLSDKFGRIADNFHDIHDEVMAIKRYEEDLCKLYNAMVLNANNEFPKEITSKYQKIYIDYSDWGLVSFSMRYEHMFIHRYPNNKYTKLGLDYILNNPDEVLANMYHDILNNKYVKEKETPFNEDSPFI